MNTKYFYYISKTKVDMLLSQFRHSKLAVPKITPKIDVVGIGIEAEIGSQSTNPPIYPPTSHQLAGVDMEI
jgi:hypothetical protein